MTLHDYQRVPNTPAHTRQHKSTHPHHFATHTDPSCSLHNATDHLLYWIGNRKNDASKNGPKVRKHGVAVLDKDQGAG